MQLLRSLAAFAVLMLTLASPDAAEAKRGHTKRRYNRRRNQNRNRPKTIVSVAQKNRKTFATLLKAVSMTGLATKLQNSGPLTLFAPTNAAFAKIDKKTLRYLSRKDTRQILKDILDYHVVAGKIRSTQLTDGQMAKTLEGGQVTFDISASGIDVNDANVVMADVDAGDSIIHAIDSILIPKSVGVLPSKDIVDIASGAKDFSTLVDLVTKAGLAHMLMRRGPFTVLAPTNAAFAKLPKATLDTLAKNKHMLRDVLKYHIVANKQLLAKDITDGAIVTKANHKRAVFNVKGNMITINGNSKVILADVMASNGVIHGIDTVLMPPQNAVQVAQTRDDLSTLVTAVTQAGLANTLARARPITILAPNNAAFAKISKADLEALLADKKQLQSVLKFHVLPGIAATAEQVAALSGRSVRTLNGNRVKIMADKSGVQIGNARAIETNILSSNAVIHIIDEVLEVPSVKKTRTHY